MKRLAEGEAIFDEFAEISMKHWEALDRAQRTVRAVMGWPNWYINRGRMSLNPTSKELRQASWRRAK